MALALPESTRTTAALVYGCLWMFMIIALTILKNMSSSMGRIVPHMMEHKSHVPNHQPAIDGYSSTLFMAQSIQSRHEFTADDPPTETRPGLGITKAPGVPSGDVLSVRLSGHQLRWPSFWRCPAHFGRTGNSPTLLL